MTKFVMEDSNAGGEDGEKREFTVIPAGEIWLAEVLEAEVKDSFFWVDVEDHSKGKQKKVNFKFTIVEPPYKGKYIWGETPTTFNNNEKCKLRHWVEEIFAFDDLSAGFEFELEDLIGQPVKIVVGNRTYNDKTTGKPVTVMFVDNVVRFEGGFQENTEEAF